MRVEIQLVMPDKKWKFYRKIDVSRVSQVIIRKIDVGRVYVGVSLLYSLVGLH